MYKIYKISTPLSNKCYIGITSQKYLSTRLNQHYYNYRTGKPYCGSYELMQHDDCHIELIMSVPTKQEALFLEGNYINQCNSVNIHKRRT